MISAFLNIMAMVYFAVYKCCSIYSVEIFIPTGLDLVIYIVDATLHCYINCKIRYAVIMPSI